MIFYDIKMNKKKWELSYIADIKFNAYHVRMKSYSLKKKTRHYVGINSQLFMNFMKSFLMKNFVNPLILLNHLCIKISFWILGGRLYFFYNICSR